MKTSYIDNDEHLLAYCETASKAPCLAMDTEFMAGRTYHPKLALIQINDGNEIALIDTLKITQHDALTRLFKTFQSPWIMHAPDQDSKILKHYCGEMPTTVYDTQSAAAFLGQEKQTSYRALVADTLDVQVSKEEQRSDWIKRPLSSTQLEYAANDVRHLIPLWKILEQRLRVRARWQWFVEEAKAKQTLQGNTTMPQPYSVYTAMLNWREMLAERMDIPPNWVVDSRHLKKIAGSKNPSCEEIKLIVGNKRRRVSATEILRVLSDFHKQYTRMVRTHIPVDVLTRGQAVLDEIAARHNVVPAVIISRKELPALLRHPENFSHGWRAPLLREVVDRARQSESD